MNATSFYKCLFLVAGFYNLAFGLWAGLWPHSAFHLLDLEPPRYPSLWACIGMIVGVYGFLYIYSARHLERAFPIIAVGLLGKVLGPCGAALSVMKDEFPMRLLWIILCNDLIWWIPFATFLIMRLRANDEA